jgi:hypothetical protein
MTVTEKDMILTVKDWDIPDDIMIRTLNRLPEILTDMKATDQSPEVWLREVLASSERKVFLEALESAIDLVALEELLCGSLYTLN